MDHPVHTLLALSAVVHEEALWARACNGPSWERVKHGALLAHRARVLSLARVVAAFVGTCKLRRTVGVHAALWVHRYHSWRRVSSFKLARKSTLKFASSYVLYRRHSRLPGGAGCRYNTLCGSWRCRWLPLHSGCPRTGGRTPACLYHSALFPHSRCQADTLPRSISHRGFLAGRVGRHTWQCGSQHGIVHLYHMT